MHPSGPCITLPAGVWSLCDLVSCRQPRAGASRQVKRKRQAVELQGDHGQPQPASQPEAAATSSSSAAGSSGEDELILLPCTPWGEQLMDGLPLLLLDEASSFTGPGLGPVLASQKWHAML